MHVSLTQQKIVELMYLKECIKGSHKGKWDSIWIILDETWIFKDTFLGWKGYKRWQMDTSFGRFILSSLSYRPWTHWIYPYLCSVSWRMAHICLYDFVVLPGFGLWTPLHLAPLMAVPRLPEVWCLLLIEGLLDSNSFGLRRYCGILDLQIERKGPLRAD